MQVQFIIVFVFSTQAGAAAAEILLMINFCNISWLALNGSRRLPSLGFVKLHFVNL
jgi:hypothetical protein